MLRGVPRASSAVILALVVSTAVFGGAACVKKPTMHLDHAEISGVQLNTFPPSLGVLMTVVLQVYNPNSYDVAVRAVRGTTMMANKYPVNVDFHAPGDGLWLPSGQTTPIRVPLALPVPLAIAVLQESFAQSTIPYRFTGSADVTATRTFQLEKDDYSVDEQGVVTRAQIADVIPNSLFPH